MPSLKFITPHENTVRKHGKFTCSWCRKEGIKKEGKVCTYRKSISWRKETCSCDEHRHLAEKQILNEINRESNEYTEADYQTWMRL